jgi:hypothetical protein
MGITRHAKVDTLKIYDRRDGGFDNHAGGGVSVDGRLRTPPRCCVVHGWIARDVYEASSRAGQSGWSARHQSTNSTCDVNIVNIAAGARSVPLEPAARPSPARS